MATPEGLLHAAMPFPPWAYDPSEHEDSPMQMFDKPRDDEAHTHSVLNAKHFIEMYADRAGPDGRGFVPAGVVVTVGGLPIAHAVPGKPSTWPAMPPKWDGQVTECLLWYARNARNPHFLSPGHAKWSDAGIVSDYVPDGFFRQAELEPDAALYPYGHYVVKPRAGGVLGWVNGSRRPARLKERSNVGGRDWFPGAIETCKGNRARPIDALLVAKRMAERFDPDGMGLWDVLRDYFERVCPKMPPYAVGQYLPELDHNGEKVRMQDWIIEDELKRLLASDNPFTSKSAPYPWGIQDMPLVVVQLELDHYPHLVDSYLPARLVWRYLRFYNGYPSPLPALSDVDETSASDDEEYALNMF